MRAGTLDKLFTIVILINAIIIGYYADYANKYRTSLNNFLTPSQVSCALALYQVAAVGTQCLLGWITMFMHAYA